MTGKGISKTPGDVIKGVPTEFTIDFTPVLPAVQQVAQRKNVSTRDLVFLELRDSLGEIVPTDCKETSPGKFTVKYTPKNIGIITVHMAINGQCLKQSGTRVSFSIGLITYLPLVT